MEKWAIGYLFGHFLSLRTPILLQPIEFISLVSLVVFLCFVRPVRFNSNKIIIVSDQSHINFANVRPFLIGLLSGCLIVWLASFTFYRLGFIEAPNQEYVIEGTVDSRIVQNQLDSNQVSPTKHQDSVRLIIEVTAVSVERINNGSNTNTTRNLTRDTKRYPWWFLRPKIVVNWYNPTRRLHQGDKIEFVAKLNQTFAYRNEYGFDYRQYAYAKGLYAKGYVKSDVTVLKYDESGKQYVLNDFAQLTSGLEQQGALLALMLGDKSLMTNKQRELLNRAGISHLFAISGLHIAVVFLVIKYVLTQVFRRFAHNDKHTWLTLLALVPIWGYVYLLDGVISANRAALFVSLWCLSQLCFVHISHFKRLLYIAVVSLIFEPFAMLQAAWWLSFSAVLGILIFIEVFGAKEQTRNAQSIDQNRVISRLKLSMGKLKAYFMTLVKFQLFISVWMMPVTIFWFAGFSLSGFIVNLVVIPVFCLFVIPYSFIMSLFSVMWLSFSRELLSYEAITREIITRETASRESSLAADIFEQTTSKHLTGESGLGVLLWLPDVVLSRMIEFIEAHHWTHIWVYVPNNLWLVFPLFAFVFLTVFMGQGAASNFTHRFITLSKTGLLTVMLLLPFSLLVSENKQWRDVLTSSISTPTVTPSQNTRPMTMRVLDVGQGTSVVFHQDNTATVYDLGPVYPSGSSATKSVVAPTLDAIGIRYIDYLIISHQDSDHKGDTLEVRRFLRKNQANQSEVDEILFNRNTSQTNEKNREQERKRNFAFKRCRQGTFDWKNNKVTTLWPLKKVQMDKTNYQVDDKTSKNDLSCVVKLTNLSSGISVLLPGDISSKVEEQLVALYAESDVLKSDILFSPHHGSRFSSSYRFLKAVSPELVIHTAGLNNRYNFPTKEVKDRVSQLGIQQVSTSEVGEIVVEFSPTNSELNFKTAVDSWIPFWKKQNPFSFDLEIR